MAEQVERLAHHALRGEVWDKALTYCRQAGEKAVAQSAYREAVEYFEQALSALPHLPGQRDTRSSRPSICTSPCTRRSCRWVTLGVSWHVCARPSPSPRPSMTQRRLRQVALFLPSQFYRMGAYDQAVAAAQRALALATASGEVALYAQANYYLGTASQAQGDYRRAIDCFRQTVASLEGTPPHERFGLPNLPAVLSRAYLAVCHAELGMFAEGIPSGKKRCGLPRRWRTPGA